MFNQMSIIVAGLIVPVLVALVSRPNIASNTRRVIALVVSIVVGAIVVIANGLMFGVPSYMQSYVIEVVKSIAEVTLIGQAIYPLMKPILTPDINDHVYGEASKEPPF